jgi:glycosyltransferase involved in cell wall biosynthesis
LSTNPLGIVIPTYNRPDALLKCLAHLENQTFKDFEVVIVDDGSTDSTPQQVEAYRATTPLRIQYVRQKNSGPATARNLGISMLRSPICLMLGDDIFASPTLVQQHLHVHELDSSIKVVALGRTRWSTSGQTITPFMQWLDEGRIQFSYQDLLAGVKADWRHFYTSNLSVKTELLRRFSFNEQFPYAAMEDMELAYRIEKQFGLEIKFLPEALADHLHPTTFRQACRRMVRVGYSCGLFYERWPEQRPPLQSSKLRRTLKHTIAQSPYLLKLLTGIANLVTRAVCPNPLMKYVLSCYYEIGYQSQANSETKPVRS